MENVKQGVRSWLNIQPANPANVNITETLDFYGNAIKNRIWYLGDSNELEQLYEQIPVRNVRNTFWGAKCSTGMEINKLHTGIPSLIVDRLTDVTMTDLNDFKFKNKPDEEIWEQIGKENDLKELFNEAVRETLFIGDGAFKITFDSSFSNYPCIEFYSGEMIDFVRKRGRITEIIFKTSYKYKGKEYILHEHYGYGYIKYQLMFDDKEVPLDGIPDTKNLRDFAFAGYTEKDGEVVSKGKYMMAVPLRFFSSSRWKGRGQSIFDKKTDSFDSLDEAWSQWMDALRSGRSREYIPECLIPRNPNTGEIMKPNAFDNRYIKTDSEMGEDARNEILLQQPSIPHESYLATYITALDLCLQGLISPSTLGIDVKKLDNADAQREKEKATLYTRNAIVNVLTEDFKKLASVCIMSYNEFTNPSKTIKGVEVEVSFGEYANPSFESQVETVGKGKQQGIMSIEAAVEELYGDTKDDAWKAEEVARLKAEQGIVEMEYPAVNTDGIQTVDNNHGISTLNGAQISSLMNVIKMVKEGSVTRNEAISIITSTLGISRENAESFIEEGMQNAGQGSKQNIPDEPGRISGAFRSSK